jgi:hypothetical protein
LEQVDAWEIPRRSLRRFPRDDAGLVTTLLVV